MSFTKCKLMQSAVLAVVVVAAAVPTSSNDNLVLTYLS